MLLFGGVVAALAFLGVARLARASEGPYDLVRQLARVLVLVENEYVDPVDRTRLLEGAIKGMVAELDPHSSYLPEEDYRIFEADTKGEFGGIGVEVDFRNETVIVIAPIEGSPAARAGIRPGDRIVAIDGSPVRGRSMQDLIRRMRGKPGSPIVVSVSRGNDDKVVHYPLKREIIQVASVASKLLVGNVAYVKLKQFQSGTRDELVRAVVKLRGEAHGTLSGVLLDLRNNPGGLVDEASAVADELLTGGVIYTTRHRGEIVESVSAGAGGSLSREPMVALVNEYSASAAELLAGALQDHKRATIVGAPTFGKGSVQSIIDLPGGAGLRLTTMRYYTPGGHAIQAQGIHPDVTIEAGAVDRNLGPIRESDLENHLAPEGAAPPEGKPSDRIVEPAADGGTPREPLDLPREVPDDPTKGKDFTLSVGYQLLEGTLKR
ncbi:MAG TPA: S41 family peptidase [Polyangiaceae bacterium]|jgi:carboxyl-terminal processing protease|nr:S41 family peptidase [Polyangiaceae bacterium]